MKIYFSVESKNKIKSCLPLKDFAVIDVVRVAQSMGYSNLEDTYTAFIVEYEIKRKLISFYKNKKTLNLLYVTQQIDKSFLPNFKESLAKLGIYFLQYVLIDCHNKIEEDAYSDFDDVV